MTPIDQIKSAYSENRTILGTVIHIGKEYLLVTVYGYPCIMSKDNVEPFFVRDFDVYFHKDVQVKILGIEENNSEDGISGFLIKMFLKKSSLKTGLKALSL